MIPSVIENLHDFATSFFSFQYSLQYFVSFSYFTVEEMDPIRFMMRVRFLTQWGVSTTISPIEFDTFLAIVLSFTSLHYYDQI